MTGPRVRRAVHPVTSTVPPRSVRSFARLEAPGGRCGRRPRPPPPTSRATFERARLTACSSVLPWPPRSLRRCDRRQVAGSLRHDLFALPFRLPTTGATGWRCRQAGAKPRRFASVANWFRKDEDGNFMWPATTPRYWTDHPSRRWRGRGHWDGVTGRYPKFE